MCHVVCSMRHVTMQSTAVLQQQCNRSYSSNIRIAVAPQWQHLATAYIVMAATNTLRAFLTSVIQAQIMIIL